MMNKRVLNRRLAINLAFVAIAMLILVPNASRPSISANKTSIDIGQQTAITVSWNGGNKPYAVNLYNGYCSNNPVNSIITNASSANFIESPSSPIDYFAGVNGSCSSSQYINVYPDPTVNISSVVSKVYGGNYVIQISAKPKGGQGGYVYTWKSDPYFGTYSCSAYYCSFYNGTLSHTETIALDINITDGAGMSASASTEVPVNVMLTSIIPSNPTIDRGQSVALEANTVYGSNNYGYVWFSGTSSTCSLDTNIAGANSQVYTANPNSSTYYCIKVQDYTYGIVVNAIGQVAVNPPLSVILNSNSVLDAGQDNMLTATVSGGTQPYTYNFMVYNSITDTAIASDLYNSSSTSNTFEWKTTPEDAGTVYANVIVTDSAYSPETKNSMPVFITVNPQLELSAVTVSRNAIEVGQTATFAAFANGGAAPLTYSWMLNGNAVGTNSAAYSFYGNSTTEGHDNISVTVKDQYGQTASGSNTITVKAQPIVSISLNSGRFEAGQPISLVAAVTNLSGAVNDSNFSISWSPNDIDFNSCTLPSCNVTLRTTGAFSGELSYIDGYGIKVSKLFSFIVVNALEIPSIYSSANVLDVGQSANISAYVSGGISPYTYNFVIFNSITNKVIANQFGASNTFVFTGNGSVVGNVLKANVSVTDSASTPETANSQGNVSITIDPSLEIYSFNVSANTVDAGTPIAISAESLGGTGPYTYNFLIINQATGVVAGNMLLPGIADTSNTLIFDPAIGIAGNVLEANVIITDSASVPEAANSISIGFSVEQLPKIAITPISATISAGQSIGFVGNVTGGTMPYVNLTYLVTQNGEPTSNEIISGNSIIFEAQGTYNISGTVTDNNLITAYSANSIIYVGSWSNMSIFGVRMNENTISKFSYIKSNATLYIKPTNNIIANVIIANITNNITSTSGVTSNAGSPVSKVVVLDINVTSGTVDSIGNMSVTIGYPSNYTSPEPYQFNGVTGQWTAIIPFTVNATLHQLTFSISPDPIIGIFGTPPPTPNMNRDMGGGSSSSVYGGGGGSVIGSGGSGPIGPTVLTKTTLNFVCSTISNFTQKNEETVTVLNMTSKVTENYITPTTAGITVGNSTYELSQNQIQPIGNINGINYTLELTGLSYLPIQDTVSIAICGSVPAQTLPSQIVPVNETVYVTNVTTSSQSVSGKYNLSTKQSVLFKINGLDANVKFVSNSSVSTPEGVAISKYNGTANLVGYELLSALNISITPGQNVTVLVTEGYACNANIESVQPYVLNNGAWTEIKNFSVDSSACQVTFLVAEDPIVALFATEPAPATIIPASSGSSAPSSSSPTLVIVVIALVVIAVIAAYAYQQRNKASKAMAYPQKNKTASGTVRSGKKR